MTVIRLNYGHLQECLEIAYLKNKVSGTTPISKSLLEEKIKKFFNNENVNYVVFGHVINNKISSWMAITFQENKSRGKYWAIISFYASNFSTYFKFSQTEYELLLRHCIDFAEQLNYNQYYYSVSEKINNVFSKQWSKSKASKTDNYYFYDKDIIPANTKPSSELYWKLIGEELKPDNIIIKHRVKKHE